MCLGRLGPSFKRRSHLNPAFFNFIFYNHFLRYNSATTQCTHFRWTFDLFIFTELCNRHHKKFQNIFVTLKWKSTVIIILYFLIPEPSPGEAPIYFRSYLHLLILGILYKQNHVTLFILDFFDLAYYFQGFFMETYQYFILSLMNNISFKESITLCLFISWWILSCFKFSVIMNNAYIVTYVFSFHCLYT